MKKNIVKTLILTLALIFVFNIVGCDDIRDGSVIKESTLTLNYVDDEQELQKIDVSLYFYETFAPKTTSHLRKIIASGFYNNTQAVLQKNKQYLILGSYTLEENVYKDLIYQGETVKGEFKKSGWAPRLRVEEGSLVMLRDPDDDKTDKRHTGKATFAIILDSSTYLSNEYFTVFGKINSGSLAKLQEMADDLYLDADNYSHQRYVGDRDEQGFLKVENGKYVNSFEYYYNAYNNDEYYTMDKNPWVYGDNAPEINNQVEYDKITNKDLSVLDVIAIPERVINVVKIKNV